MNSETATTRDDAVRVHVLGDEKSAVRKLVVSLLAEAARDWGRAPDRIARAMRESRGLNSAERRFASEAVFTVVRHHRRFAFLAGIDEETAEPGTDPALLLAVWLKPLAPDEEEARLAAIADPVRRVAIACSYPDWVVERLARGTGGLAGAEALLVAMNRRGPLTVRTNRLKGTRDELVERLAAIGVPAAATRFASDGLVLETRRNVYEMAPFREGWMELQDEGSQLVAELVAPPPRGTVIDACAGAGGKTLALGALLGNRGRLVAFDISAVKLVELRKRARRAGLTCVHALEVEAGPPTAPPPGPPDGTRPASRVLVDAPCSGLGVVRRNPETKWRVRPADLDELPRKQAAILAAYAPLVEAGGRLVYATCSVFPEENDAVVEAFVAAHPEFEIVPVKEIWGSERARAVGDGTVLRVLPEVHDTDGFYAAVLRRRR